MTRGRSLAAAVLALRVAYGAALIAAPERLTRRWLGPGAGRPPVQVPLRALGMRELLLNAGGLSATLRGARARPWLAAAIVGDLTDIAATISGRSGLPAGSVEVTATVAGCSALLSAVVAAATE